MLADRPLHALGAPYPAVAVGARARFLFLFAGRFVVPRTVGLSSSARARSPRDIPPPLVVIRSWYLDRDEHCYRLSPLGGTVYARERVRTLLSFLSLFYVSLLVRSNLRSTARPPFFVFAQRWTLLPERVHQEGMFHEKSCMGFRMHVNSSREIPVHAIKAVVFEHREQIRLNRCFRWSRAFGRVSVCTALT